MYLRGSTLYEKFMYEFSKEGYCGAKCSSHVELIMVFKLMSMNCIMRATFHVHVDVSILSEKSLDWMLNNMQSISSFICTIKCII